MLPSLAIPLLIVFDEARVIFEIVPPKLFVIPFVMVLVSFRVRFTIVALELLVIVPIEEFLFKVRLLIVARGLLPPPNTIALIPELSLNVIVLSVPL